MIDDDIFISIAGLKDWLLGNGWEDILQAINPSISEIKTLILLTSTIDIFVE